MSFCSNCGNPLEENAKFCSKCGSAIAASTDTPAAPVEVPAEPVYSAPVYTPIYSTPAVIPQVTGKTKALGFIGMGLGIGGLFFSIIGIIYTLLGMGFDGLGFGFSIGFGLFSMPLSIVGRILAGRSRDSGNLSGACGAGTSLGLAGFIVSCVMLFLGFISLLAI